MIKNQKLLHEKISNLKNKRTGETLRKNIQQIKTQENITKNDKYDYGSSNNDKTWC